MLACGARVQRSRQTRGTMRHGGSIPDSGVMFYCCMFVNFRMGKFVIVSSLRTRSLGVRRCRHLGFCDCRLLVRALCLDSRSRSLTCLCAP